MKVKNLVLVGFILSAISYLSKQIEEEKESEQGFLNELDDIDLEEIKKELGSKLEKAIVEFGDVVGSIAKIGSNAFDKFLSDAEEGLHTEELAEELKAAVVLKQESEEVTDEVETESDETVADEVVQMPENAFDDLISTLIQEEVETVEKPNEEEDGMCGFSALDRKVMSLFEDAAKRSRERKAEEAKAVVEAEAEKAEEVEENVEDSLWRQPEIDTEALLQDLRDTLNSFSLEEPETIFTEVGETEQTIEQGSAEPEVETAEEEAVEVNDEEALFREIQEAVEKKLPEKDLSELFDDLLVDTHAHIEKEVNKDEIDAIFKEILDQENDEAEAAAEDETPVVEEELEPEETVDDYVQELIEDLPEVEELENVPDVYDQIRELYPYLSKAFIRSVYDLKEVIAEEYPYGKDVIVLHRVSFSNLEDLQQFVEIVTNHKYGVNVDERKMIVDLFKMYRNTDGKILTNIFEIANQAKPLHGEYEGYRVEVKE